MSPIDMLAHRMEALSDTTLRRSLSAHPEQVPDSGLSRRYAEQLTKVIAATQSAPSRFIASRTDISIYPTNTDNFGEPAKIIDGRCNDATQVHGGMATSLGAV